MFESGCFLDEVVAPAGNDHFDRTVFPDFQNRESTGRPGDGGGRLRFWAARESADEATANGVVGHQKDALPAMDFQEFQEGLAYPSGEKENGFSGKLGHESEPEVPQNGTEALFWGVSREPGSFHETEIPLAEIIRRFKIGGQPGTDKRGGFYGTMRGTCQEDVERYSPQRFGRFEGFLSAAGAQGAVRCAVQKSFFHPFGRSVPKECEPGCFLLERGQVHFKLFVICLKRSIVSASFSAPSIL